MITSNIGGSCSIAAISVFQQHLAAANQLIISIIALETKEMIVMVISPYSFFSFCHCFEHRHLWKNAVMAGGGRRPAALKSHYVFLVGEWRGGQASKQ